jgi:hypothetical protein
MRFTRDRWYSNEGQRRLHQRARSESMGTRRVISLALLLLMILVVMQRLNDPKKYQPAFEAIGLVPSNRANFSAASNTTGSPNASSSRPQRNAALLDNREGDSSSVGSIETTIEARRLLSVVPESPEVDLWMQMWLRLLEPASPEVLRELAKAELSPRLSVNTEKDEPNSSTSVMPSNVLEWFDRTQVRVESWQQEYRAMKDGSADESLPDGTDWELGMKFVAQWLSWASLHRNGISLASSSLDQDLRRALHLAIDRRMLGMIDDSSPWHPHERPVFARTLQRATKIADAFDADATFRRDTLQASPMIEVNSLTKQANEYRGQLVRIIGNNVTNPAPTTQVIDGWGQFKYDVVWIRPVDGSQQPICLYSFRQPDPGWPKVTSSRYSESPTESKEKDIDDEETPLVEVSAILLKRLAYPSQRGIDVAPVLVACHVRWLPDAPYNDHHASQPQSASFRSRRWIEPGEQAVNLRLLSDVFSKDLESFSSELPSSNLTDPNQATENPQPVQLLASILYQMPRVSKPLAAAVPTGKKIGPAQLGSIQGRVHSLKALPIRNATAVSNEPLSIFRLQIEPSSDIDQEPADEPLTHVAFVNRIPNLWNDQKELSQPVSLSGLFLDAKTENGTTRCWIADHPDWSWRWRSESSRSSKTFLPPLPDDWMQLGESGFDLTHADVVGNLRGKSITTHESQAFFSLIDCCDRLSMSDSSLASPALSAIDCLRAKDPPYLRRVRSKVHVVRATRILVTDEQDRTALDGDAYYELDGLANLGNLSVQLKSTDGKDTVTFNGEYPITLIAKQLPAWLAVSTDASSEAPATWYPRTTVEVEGIFYRLWSFNTAQTSAVGKTVSSSGVEETKLKQIGPLVAVTKWEKPLVETPFVSNRSIVRDVMVAIGFTAIGIYAFFRWNQPMKRRKA